MSDERAGGFLARWSRRKAGVAEAPVEAPMPVAPTAATALQVELEAEAAAVADTPPAEAVPLPTLEDVARLTRHSDYSRFVLPGVEPGVKNAALKKLFSDPHFNVMDGLDTYIDDYGKPDPIPLAMLRAMNQSAVLGLFDDEEDEGGDVADAKASPNGEGAAMVAESRATEPVAEPAGTQRPRDDDDPDLRLQQDDAAGRPGAGPGADD
ncbi:MAG: DUF3306 domain-containing protein [Caldimonas sp.]